TRKVCVDDEHLVATGELEGRPHRGALPAARSSSRETPPAPPAPPTPAGSPVTTSVRPTTTAAASTSASIARDRSRRVLREASSRVFPSVPANGATTVVIGRA